MRFRIKAMTTGQGIEEMTLDAMDEPSARRLADSRGLTVLSIKRTSSVSIDGRGKFPLLLFSQELLALLQSGLALVESIQTLAEKESRSHVRAVLDGLLAGLSQGRTFSQVLSEAAGIFPDLFVAMIRAAERTSDLDRALARYIAYQREVDALRGKLVSASIYPVMLLAVGGLVVLFLLGYVVPRFSGVFEDAGTELPFASRLLLEWGNFMANNAGLAALAVCAAVAGVVMISRNAQFRGAVGHALWRIPGVGERLKVFQLARFYRTLSMLLSGGLTALTAMTMSRDLLSAALREGLDVAMRDVREGKGLADALTAHKLTTPVANRMLRVGERAGNLVEMTERIAVFHEEEISRWVDWLTRLIGPALMLIIGLVIGVVVVLMYLPIFQLAESIQ